MGKRSANKQAQGINLGRIVTGPMAKLLLSLPPRSLTKKEKQQAEQNEQFQKLLAEHRKAAAERAAAIEAEQAAAAAESTQEVTLDPEVIQQATDSVVSEGL